MQIRKTYCEDCRKEIKYTIIEEEKIDIIKDVLYKYKGKTAYCNECKKEVYVIEIEDYNLYKLYDTYREKNNIISLKKIKEITKKYNIGKRPLSLLLGWGEQTYTRYYDGDIPTKQYSEVLKKIYNDPLFYNEILEENKENLKSYKTYEKSKNTVLKLINKESNNSKIYTAIEYLLKECEDITPLALQKILYYVQGFNYTFNDYFIFEEDCKAWVHGPVYEEIYYKYKDYKYETIKYKNKTNKEELKEKEIEILNSVIKNISCYSGKILEKFTLLETPWVITRGKLGKNELCNKIIKKEEIAKYFKIIKEKYNMKTPEDIYLYTEEIFKQIK